MQRDCKQKQGDFSQIVKWEGVQITLETLCNKSPIITGIPQPTRNRPNHEILVPDCRLADNQSRDLNDQP